MKICTTCGKSYSWENPLYPGECHRCQGPMPKGWTLKDLDKTPTLPTVAVSPKGRVKVIWKINRQQ